MSYTPNNPYMPGDPYSYDLKWIVSELKKVESSITGLDDKIAAAVVAALDQHDPVYYKTAQELVESGQKAPSIAYIEGYHKAGDGGANLYYVTDDYSDVLNAVFYITMDSANKWAIPVLTTPYVTPEMFGAYGDNINDDTAAFNIAVRFDRIIANGNYLISQPIVLSNNKTLEINGTINTSGIAISIRGRYNQIYGSGHIKAGDIAINLDDNGGRYNITFNLISDLLIEGANCGIFLKNGQVNNNVVYYNKINNVNIQNSNNGIALIGYANGNFIDKAVFYNCAIGINNAPIGNKVPLENRITDIFYAQCPGGTAINFEDAPNDYYQYHISGTFESGGSSYGIRGLGSARLSRAFISIRNNQALGNSITIVNSVMENSGTLTVNDIVINGEIRRPFSRSYQYQLTGTEDEYLHLGTITGNGLHQMAANIKYSFTPQSLIPSLYKAGNSFCQIMRYNNTVTLTSDDNLLSSNGDNILLHIPNNGTGTTVKVFVEIDILAEQPTRFTPNI